MSREREKPNGKYSVSRGFGLDMRAEIANHARLAADIINYLIITAICDECKKENEQPTRHFNAESARWAKEVKAESNKNSQERLLLNLVSNYM